MAAQVDAVVIDRFLARRNEVEVVVQEATFATIQNQIRPALASTLPHRVKLSQRLESHLNWTCHLTAASDIPMY